MTIDLSDLQGGGGKPPAKKKQDKPLLTTVPQEKVDTFCQGKGIEKEGQQIKAPAEAEIKEAYTQELFNRNAGVAEASKTFRAMGTSNQDRVTVYHNTNWARCVLQNGTEVSPEGQAKTRALKDAVKSKYDKCFEEHLEVKMDTSDIPKALRDEFVMDMIAVLNKYHQAHTLRKVLKFTPEFEAGRYEMLTPAQNLLVNQHMPVSVIVR